MAKTARQIIYIVSSDTALSHSERALLDAHGFKVSTLDILATSFDHIPFHEEDVIVFDLDQNQFTTYRLLNELLNRIHRPGIILTTALRSALEPTDIFPGTRIELLFHPVAPKMLLKTVKGLSTHVEEKLVACP